MNEIFGMATFYKFEGYEYPAAHWAELSRFATGDERDPKELFRLSDDIWRAWPYAEHGRRNDSKGYSFHFGHLRSWLKPYVKRYCYQILLGSSGALKKHSVELPYTLSKIDRYIVEQGILSIDALAVPAVFEALWEAHLSRVDGDSAPDRLPEAAVVRQRATRPFWRDLSARFGVPRFIPPVAPYKRKTPAEVGADESKLIPDAVTRQLTNNLALHRDGIKLLNNFDHLRLCVLLLVISLGRRIEEILTAGRGPGTEGPLERYPCRHDEGEPADALWFRFHANKGGLSVWVYVSPQWEELVIYCVHQLLRYGDEVRTFAAPTDRDLLILVSTWNWTANSFAKKAIIPDKDQDFGRIGAHGGSQYIRRSGLRLKRAPSNKNHTVGITSVSFRAWMNGITRIKEPGRATASVMRQWNITSDGSERGDIYIFRSHQARHTRHSALARDPEIPLLTKQRDLNHTDPEMQLFYQHALNEQNNALMSKITANPLSVEGVDWLHKLLGVEDNRLIDDRSQEELPLVGIMTPRRRKLLKNHPAYVEPNKIDVGICDDPEGPENCDQYQKSVKSNQKMGAAHFKNSVRPNDGLKEHRSRIEGGREESLNGDSSGTSHRSESMALTSVEVLLRLKERQRQIGEEADEQAAPKKQR